MAMNQIPISLQGWGLQLMNLRTAYLQKRQSDTILKAQGAAMLAKLAAMVDGGDLKQLESQLGLQAGQGKTVFDQTNSVVGNFADDTKTQAEVNAAIDQFCAFMG